MTRQLLNTLYVQTQGAYLRLDGDTVRVDVEQETRLRVPLHHLGGLVVFGNVLVSPFLLARCADDGRAVVWLSAYGRFRGRLAGAVSGNVLLRRAQHEALADPDRRTAIARQCVRGKLRSARRLLLRARRDARKHDAPTTDLDDAIDHLLAAVRSLPDADSVPAVRGVEGNAAAVYFGVFDALLRVRDFRFTTRSRRPPRDPTNALLSFLYTLVRGDCETALESVGLDPQVGFLHTLRPGRPALALDLMEEFRHGLADRLALTLLNRRQLTLQHFEPREGGAVYLNETGRKTVLTAYQERKQVSTQHRLFKDAVPIGLVPFIQARLLARHLRGDLDHYPPFHAK